MFCPNHERTTSLHYYLFYKLINPHGFGHVEHLYYNSLKIVSGKDIQHTSPLQAHLTIWFFFWNGVTKVYQTFHLYALNRRKGFFPFTITQYLRSLAFYFPYIVTQKIRTYQKNYVHNSPCYRQILKLKDRTNFKSIRKPYPDAN